MIRYIPPRETRRWDGPYLGNYYGTLWKTFNVDLDREEGKIFLSSRMPIIEDSTELPALGAVGSVKSFIRTDADCTDRYWALAGTGMLKTDSAAVPLPSDDWDSDNLDSTVVDGLDMTVVGNDSRADSGRNQLFVTRDTGDIAVLNDTGTPVWNGTWWTGTQAQPSLNRNTAFHPIEYFPFRKIALVGDGNLVHTISRPSDTQNDTVSFARLILPSYYSVQHIFTTSNRAWLLCHNRIGGSGAVVEWDGFSQSPNEFHNIYGMSALTGVNYRETPIVVTSRGLILEYTGKGFMPMLRNGQQTSFPIVEIPGGNLTATASDTADDAFIAPRGATVGQDGLVYFNLRFPTPQNSFRQAAGIWCLNPVTGRLYNKHALGRWGDSVDYGQPSLQDNGGIYYVTTLNTDTAYRPLLASGRVASANGVFEGGIWLLDNYSTSTATRGHFVTQPILSDDVKEFWDSLWIRFERIATSGSSIVVKARGVRSILENGGPVEAVATWTSTTTFTVTLAAVAEALVVGDEIEVLRGRNSGYLAHITIISGAHGALQTITIDETMQAGSSTSRVRFDRWKKLGTITSTTTYEQMMAIGIDSSFIQFKVEIRGPAREMKFSDMIVTSKQSIKLES